LDFVSITITPNPGYPVVISGNSFSINFVTLRPSDSYSITILTRVNHSALPPGGDNVVSLSPSPPDGDPLFNDSASSPITILPSNPISPRTGFAPGRNTALDSKPAGSDAQATDLTLEIPALGLNASIVGVPAEGNSWNVSWLGKDVGYLYGTAFPTWAGNSVLTAHVYTSDGLPGPFVNLDQLRWGDQVLLHAFGQIYVYEVREAYTTTPEDSSPFGHKDLPWVTLITCKQYNPASGTYQLRTVVQAVQVRIIPDDTAGPETP
jgi:LPXTG-site transpeptidase (sortase) family protein